MRKIGFRVWDKQTKSYDSYSEFVLSPSGELMELYSRHNGTWEYHFADTDRFIIEFDTGLKDKNGKEIYEGDIMRYDAIDYKVLWADYYAGFETKILNSPWNNAGLTLHFLAGVGRVIGNIHENGDLLKGAK